MFAVFVCVVWLRRRPAPLPPPALPRWPAVVLLPVGVPSPAAPRLVDWSAPLPVPRLPRMVFPLGHPGVRLPLQALAANLVSFFFVSCSFAKKHLLFNNQKVLIEFSVHLSKYFIVRFKADTP